MTVDKKKKRWDNAGKWNECCIYHQPTALADTLCWASCLLYNLAMGGDSERRAC